MTSFFINVKLKVQENHTMRIIEKSKKLGLGGSPGGQWSFGTFKIGGKLARSTASLCKAVMIHTIGQWSFKSLQPLEPFLCYLADSTFQYHQSLRRCFLSWRL